MAQQLIIGGGPAAINAVETIRDCDRGTNPITLVSDEPAYSRMVLPYYLAGQIPEEQVYIADDAYLDSLKVDRRFGRSVQRVDAQAKLVTLDDGQQIAFDNLLIATGSSPTIPPIPGADLPGVFPLWTLAQTRSVLQTAAGKSKLDVVFIGAGFIGFIVLNAMYKRGWDLHLVEIADHVLPRMLDSESAMLVEQWLRQKGIGLHLGTTVRGIADKNGRKRVSLSKGPSIDADLVIVATGIRPNVEFLRGAGINIAQGILVDNRMQTNWPFVYAAGDVAEGPDLLGDIPVIHAIQPTAVDHGRIAGANMAGQEVRYAGSLLMNILDACGLQCASFGRWSETGAENVTICNPDRPVYRKLLWTDDQITGAVFVGPANDLGMLNDVGMVKGIIQTRTALAAWKEFLRENPFDIRRPFVAAKVGQKLAESTLLGRPSRSRQYRFRGRQPGPQITQPQAHQDFLGTKG
ncbi:MAG TPA: FAD-dependent oxidoreductase [Gemmataceae bacterium]|nr:FAD-dependent oxidoreductase [Gemmataceae bacterium]